MVLNGPITGFNHQQRKRKIDDNGGEGEEDIDCSVFPLIVFESKQGNSTFNYPEKSNSTGKDQGTMQTGNGVEIINNRLNHGSKGL